MPAVPIEVSFEFGIWDPAYLKRCSRRFFFRSVASKQHTSLRNHGSDLGLAIARRAVVANGGQMAR